MIITIAILLLLIIPELCSNMQSIPEMPEDPDGEEL